MTDARTTETEMDRMTIRMPDPMLDALDAYVESGHAPSRSEAVRIAVNRLCGDPVDQDRTLAELITYVDDDVEITVTEDSDD